MKKSILITVVCLCSHLVFSQNADSIMIKIIVDETMRNGTAYQSLRKLCKQVGPRLSGSPNYLKAVTMVSGMMKEIGADKVYTQQCAVPHWVRGEKEKGQIILSDGKKYDLKLCALGNSVGTSVNGINANVVEVNSMAQLDQLGTKGIKGKIIFFNFPMNPTYIKTFQAYGESGISRNRGPAAAAKYGAVGAMVRSLAINLNDYPHTGATGYNDSFPKIPAVAISTNDAEYLSKELKKGNIAKAFFKTSCKILPDAIGYNVIGEIKGSQFPDEIITVGGHLDSWDLAEGANDDGSGVVQAMEVLRTLKALGITPKRTIRAVAFANEENGGRGAKKYLEEAKAKNEKIIFALESDAGGFTPRGFSLDMKDAQRNKIMQWKYLFYPYGASDIIVGGSGSDVGPLKEIGTALAGFTPDSQRYFDIHHAATDVFENVSERELKLGAANITALIWLVSEYGL
ncbi:MAG: M20/M25/M40 family metallo-hydrolase [Bacteroidota bacterium]|nr:M20/M25/M40 family metallo-hydrolase [Bacteroidota bacterium]